MNIFGIGIFEILLVLLIAFLVVGPKHLPEVAVQLARTIRGLRRYASQMTGQFRREFDDLSREYEELKAEVRDLRQHVDRDVDAATKEADETLKETRRSLSQEPIIETVWEPLPEEPSGEPKP